MGIIDKGKNGFLKIDKIDLGLITLLAILSLAYLLLAINSAAHPIEDAAMIMRYAQHIADGHGIVWNVGEKPVDGATDFLFMVVLAAVYKTGLTLETSVRLIDIASIILTVIIVYHTNRSIYHSKYWMAFLAGIFILLGPEISYIQAYFGTPFFILWVSIAWYYASGIIVGDNKQSDNMLFAAASLVMGLIRPDGVFLAVFMLFAVVFVKGLKRARETIIIFIAFIAILGGAYFLWRWNLFGYPLPNPFYIKGGGTLHFSALYDSTLNVIRLTLPFLLVFTIALISILLQNDGRKLKLITMPLIPLITFTGIWVLLSNDMNYMARFQYAVVPILVTSWVPAYEYIIGTMSKLRISEINSRAILAALLITGIILVVLYTDSASTTPAPDGRYNVAIGLSHYSYKNYTILTTEAGLLPYYSGWRAIDAWGLNDQYVAHNGIISEEYISQYNPEVIMFHAFFSPRISVKLKDDRWNATVKVLQQYAENHDYILAAVYGIQPDDTHYYYVKRNFSDSQAIVQLLRNSKYEWYTNGQICYNYV